jgi:phosphoenolpyruvate-protein kinase (PTS system EI component)
MYDVGPSDVARLNKDRVAGILTAVGGASAHSAIVARALFLFCLFDLLSIRI